MMRVPDRLLGLILAVGGKKACTAFPLLSEPAFCTGNESEQPGSQSQGAGCA